MLCCRCFVEISLISIILFQLSKERKQQRNAKIKNNFDKTIIRIVMIVQVKLIGKFQTISHATFSVRLASAERLSKILSYKVFKHIQSKHTNCNQIPYSYEIINFVKNFCFEKMSVYTLYELYTLNLGFFSNRLHPSLF